MKSRNVIWPPAIRKKLSKYRSEYFTPEETYEFIISVISEVNALLKNPILTKTYTEEYGINKGMSRIVVKKFRVYYKENANDIIIQAILFPGEQPS